MKANKKKIIILASMLLLLVATGVLNYYTNIKIKDVDPVDSGGVTLTFFESTKKNRENTRNEQLAILNEIITVNTSAESVLEAEAEKMAIVRSMETELLLESLIMAKGFEDVIVDISPKLVNIVVGHTNMTLEESAKIFDIVVSQTDYKPEEIQIVPYG